MAVREVGSAEHLAVVADLEAGLGPFEDPVWRAELAVLEQSWRSASVQWALDCRTIASLAARVPRSAGDERGGTPWTSFLREIALARRCSDRAAHGEVQLALALTSRHPSTLRALETGQAPVHRARALVEACALHTDEVVAAVEHALAGRLASLTPTRIRQEIDRTALRLDATAAARKQAAATAGRTAERRALPDGQAEITLTGPAAVVQRWWDALTDQARALKAAGDPRSLGALRFDLALTTDPRTSTGTDPLLNLLTGRPPAPPRPAAPPGADAPADGLGPTLTDDGRCSRPVQAHITVPAATALGLSDEPGWLDGHGWLAAPTCRQLLTAAELIKACVAPHTGQLIDLTDRPLRPRLTPTALRDAVRSMVLTPHQLRDMVVDPQPQHDPSPRLEAFVRARDRYCDGPTGTQVPAARTDTDHHQPWPTGPTAAANLISRAGRTHQLKHTGWHATRDGTGTHWTSPAGQSAFAPAHHHPPEPLPTDATLPDPDQQTEHDAALLAIPDWPDDDEPAIEPEPACQETSATTATGWPDDPAF